LWPATKERNIGGRKHVTLLLTHGLRRRERENGSRCVKKRAGAAGLPNTFVTKVSPNSTYYDAQEPYYTHPHLD
jgi:hypothetical protein